MLFAPRSQHFMEKYLLWWGEFAIKKLLIIFPTIFMSLSQHCISNGWSDIHLYSTFILWGEHASNEWIYVCFVYWRGIERGELSRESFTLLKGCVWWEKLWHLLSDYCWGFITGNEKVLRGFCFREEFRVILFSWVIHTSILQIIFIKKITRKCC